MSEEIITTPILTSFSHDAVRQEREREERWCRQGDDNDKIFKRGSDNTAVPNACNEHRDVFSIPPGIYNY